MGIWFICVKWNCCPQLDDHKRRVSPPEKMEARALRTEFTYLKSKMECLTSLVSKLSGNTEDLTIHDESMIITPLVLSTHNIYLSPKTVQNLSISSILSIRTNTIQYNGWYIYCYSGHPGVGRVPTALMCHILLQWAPWCRQGAHCTDVPDTATVGTLV